MFARLRCVSICATRFVRSVSSLYRPVFPVHHVLFAHGSVGEPARVSASQADGYVTCFSPVRSRVRARASLCPRVTVLLGWFRNSSAGRKPSRSSVCRVFVIPVQQDPYRTENSSLCPPRPLQDRNLDLCPTRPLRDRNPSTSVQQDPYRAENPNLCPVRPLQDRNPNLCPARPLRGQTFVFRHSTRGRVTPSAARLETGTRPNAVGGREGEITVKTGILGKVPYYIAPSDFRESVQ